MLLKLTELKELLKNIKKDLGDLYSEEKVELDHAAYITISKEEYEKAKKEVGAENKLIAEIFRTSRKISIFELKDPIEESDLKLTKVAVVEPKPGAEITRNEWQHVSFVIDDLDKLIAKYKGTPKELKKIRQIGDDRFAYYEGEKYEIQFRNNKFAPGKGDENTEYKSEENEKNESPKTEDKSTSSENYQALYEEEKNKRLMLLAEIDNEKKRMERQKEEFIKIANAALMSDLFEVVDDINRASMNNENDESLKMIYNKILGLLNNYGVIPETVKVGDKFDPSKMEAITTIKAEPEKDNTIIHIEQIGFKRKEDDRVLRTTRVIVGKA